MKSNNLRVKLDRGKNYYIILSGDLTTFNFKNFGFFILTTFNYFPQLKGKLNFNLLMLNFNLC